MSSSEARGLTNGKPPGFDEIDLVWVEDGRLSVTRIPRRRDGLRFLDVLVWYVVSQADGLPEVNPAKYLREECHIPDEELDQSLRRLCEAGLLRIETSEHGTLETGEIWAYFVHANTGSELVAGLIGDWQRKEFERRCAATAKAEP